MKIDGLIPTQNFIRNYESVLEMKSFVENKGVFNLESMQQYHEGLQINRTPQRIAISKCEDEATYIRDGHHRILSIWLANRETLLSEEYVIENRSYEDFMEVSKQAFDKGFVTPFDPRLYVRFANLMFYKEKVPKEWEKAKSYILKAWQEKVYLCKREDYEGGFWHIKTLAGDLR